MKTMTRMNAFALFAVAAVTLGVATWDAQVGSSPIAAPVAATELVAPSFTGRIDTGWLPATQARHEIEELGAALDRLALERGIDVRVLVSNAQLRTRAVDGARLEAPLARFERSFEFRVQNAGDVEALRNQLKILAVEVEPQALDERYAGRAKLVEF